MRRLLLALLLTPLIASCTRPEPPPPAGTAPVTFRVSWPAGAQAIPPAARSVVVSVAPYADPGAVAASATIDRPATSATLNAPLGDDLFSARAYDRPGGQGTLLATGQVRYTVVAGQENVVTLTLGAVVERVTLGLPRTDLNVGDQVQAVATAYDPSGAAVVGASFTFASSDRGVAEVDAQGRVRAVAPGRATLTATEVRSGKQASVAVTVTRTVIGVERVELGPGGGSLPAGGSVQLLARALDAQGQEVEGAEIRFSSSDGGVLEVDARGRALARAPGRATLTASAGGKSASVTLEVTPASAAPDAARWEPMEPPAYGVVADLARAADGGEFLLALEAEGAGPYGRPALYRRAGAGASWAPVYAEGLPASVHVISRLTPHPANPLELWAVLVLGEPYGGEFALLWRSDNGGRSFRRVLAFSEAVSPEDALTFHPADPSVLYIGCWRSGDGGATWAKVTGCGSGYGYGNIVFSPAEPGVLYQWGSSLRRSTDGGKTFRDLTLPKAGDNPVSPSRVGVAPGGRVFLSGNVYDPASWSRTYYLYRSDDRGDSWSLVGSWDNTYGFDGRFVFVPGDPSRVYIWNNSGPNAWLYSTDGGLSFSWTTLDWFSYSPPVPDPAAPGVIYGFKDLSRGQEPRYQEPLYQVLRSADHGASWRDAGAVVNSVQTFPPSRLKAVGGGFYVLGQGLWAWDPAAGRLGRGAHNRGLLPLTLLGADRGQPGRVFAAFRGAAYASDDGGLSWAPRPGFPGLQALAQSPADPLRWLAAGGLGNVYASSDGLQALRWVGRLPLQDGAAVRALALGSAQADRAYAATPRGVYRSDDGGAAWRWAGEGLRDADVSDLAVDPADDNRLFAATRGGGVFVSEDGGATWRAANRGLENRDLTSVCLAADRQTLFAGAYDGGVYVSLDQGGTWSWASSIPNYAIDDVACDPSDANVVYAATAGGVYKSVDKGASWKLASAGLTSPFATGLWVSPDGQTLYAQTADQGVFRGTPAAGAGAGFDLRAAGRKAARRP